jgi:hypothetical protein
MNTVNSARSQARVRYFTEQLNNRTSEVLARASLPKIDPALTSIKPNPRARYYTEQLNNRTRELFARLSIPKVDPCLITISRAASRLIDAAEVAYTDIMNASSNDGREVTITQWFRCAREDREHFKGERVETYAAYNIFVMDVNGSLEDLIREWWFKHYRVSLFNSDFYESKEKIEAQAPDEIKWALEAFAIVRKRRDALIDILDLSMRSSIHASAH